MKKEQMGERDNSKMEYNTDINRKAKNNFNINHKTENNTDVNHKTEYNNSNVNHTVIVGFALSTIIKG